MGTETGYVMSNLNAFGQHLEDEGVDYRVVLVGSSRSCCNICVNSPLASSACGFSGPRYLEINELILSVDAMSRMAEVDVYNKYTGSSFLRKDAAKTIVFISDDAIKDKEYDGSTNPGEYGCCSASQKPDDVVSKTKALKWLNDIQTLDASNDFFTPTPKLSHGVMVHTIDAHECPGESGYQKSFVYKALAAETGGTNFRLCNNDWSSYFSTIAGAVEESTIGAKCDFDVPRSTADPALLIGELEPDTPFSLHFVHGESSGGGGGGTIKFVKDLTNTCVESGCPTVGQPDPCVCSMRCPIGFTRSTIAPSICERPNQPSCSLAYCYSSTVNPTLTKCATNNLDVKFIVDDPSDPNKAILCAHSCHVVQSYENGGNASFAFHPVAKLRSMTVGGRGSVAATSFGTPRTLHPAHAYPEGHPATTRQDCGGAPSRPTIPETGPGLFSSGGTGGTCPATAGTSIFYALDPATGRSKTFASGAGLMIFFLVNSVGESYLGIQIGHYPDGSDGTGIVAAGYGVIDIILSGATVDTMSPKPHWVVQDGGSTSKFGGNDIGEKKSGRVVVSNLQGKTAGGILGPLPAYDFCVDLIIVEASGSVSTASIVNFDTATSKPAQPEQYRLAGDFMEDGGMRFCANKCNGDVVDETESRHSVTCWTSKAGDTYCPGLGDKDTDQSVAGPDGGSGNSGGDGGNGDDGSTTTTTLTPSTTSSNSTEGDQATDGNQEMNGSLSKIVLYVLLVVGGLVCCIGVAAVVVVYRRRRERKKQPERPSVAMTEMKGTKRKTISVRMCASSWSIVIDPLSGDQYYYNSETMESQWDPPEEIRVALETSKRASSSGVGGGGQEKSESGEWYPFQTEDGHTAYAHSLTGEVTWDKPEGGSGGGGGSGDGGGGGAWSPFETEDGFTAYRNDISGEVSWTHPDNPIEKYDANPMQQQQKQRGRGVQFSNKVSFHELNEVPSKV